MSIIDRDDFAHLDDDELIVRGVHVSAERARLEGAELHEAGFRMVSVRGMDRMLWKRDGRLYTTAAALAEAGIIPEIKEDAP